MQNKKRFFCFLSIGIIAIGLLLCLFLLPLANIVSKTMDADKVVIDSASGTFNLLTFTKVMAYLFDVSFNADGPVWLAILGFALNWLIVAGLILLITLIIFELVTIRHTNWTSKKNVLTKKVALAVGYLAVGVSIFEIVACIITTSMADEYFEYKACIAVYITIACAVGIFVCAYLSCKKQGDQQASKIRESTGFLLTFLFAGLFAGLVFIPQTIDNLSFWNMSYLANAIGEQPVAGNIFVGVSQWATFALAIPLVFLAFYSLFGFCRSLIGKSTNWLSGAVKRWSLVWLVLTLVYLFLMTATITVLYGSFYLDGTFILKPWSYVMQFLPYLPYIFSTTISINKNRV